MPQGAFYNDLDSIPAFHNEIPFHDMQPFLQAKETSWLN